MHHLIPQAPCLVTATGEWAADYVVRTERLQEDMREVRAGRLQLLLQGRPVHAVLQPGCAQAAPCPAGTRATRALHAYPPCRAALQPGCLTAWPQRRLCVPCALGAGAEPDECAAAGGRGGAGCGGAAGPADKREQGARGLRGPVAAAAAAGTRCGGMRAGRQAGERVVACTEGRAAWPAPSCPADPCSTRRRAPQPATTAGAAAAAAAPGGSRELLQRGAVLHWAALALL